MMGQTDMGASREGFDLFTKSGRIHFLRSIKRHKFPTYVWVDNLIWCWVAGHDRYDANKEHGDPEWACKRCHHYL